MRWESMIAFEFKRSAIEVEINDLGKQGWEPVTLEVVLDDKGEWHWYVLLKRTLDEKQD